MILDHIALIVSKEENLNFYEKLGFRAKTRFERAYDTVDFMECEGIVLEMFVDSNHSEGTSKPEQKGLCYIVVENLEEIMARFYVRKYEQIGLEKDLCLQRILMVNQ